MLLVHDLTLFLSKIDVRAPSDPPPRSSYRFLGFTPDEIFAVFYPVDEFITGLGRGWYQAFWHGNTCSTRQTLPFPSIHLDGRIVTIEIMQKTLSPLYSSYVSKAWQNKNGLISRKAMGWKNPL